jgi:hypothetical protein
MGISEKSLLNRRSFAVSALTGGASLLFGASAQASPNAPGRYPRFLDARGFGAVGDGVTDDTEALQRGIDTAGSVGGAIFVPPGIYLTKELHLRPGVSLVGIPAWNYSGPGGSVLRLASADSSCLVNLTDARGATVEGIALDGRGLGTNIHGFFTDRTVFPPHEDSFRIDTCQASGFSGDGARLMCVWCFSVRHSQLAHNGGDGLSLRGWDGFILDNWFSGNRRVGFAARDQNAAITFTANRIEWNHEENMLVMGGDGYQITGNYFDRAGTCGLALRPRNNTPCTQFSITGNFFKRAGKLADGASHDSAQLVIEGATSVSCIGNSFVAGRDDGDKGIWSPSFGIVYSGLEDSVISGNVLHNGALSRLLVNLGGHGKGVVVKDNPGRLFQS